MAPTWIATFRAIKASHIPVGNIIGAAHRVIFRSCDTRTIVSCPLRGATRHDVARCGVEATRRDAARVIIIIEYYEIIANPARLASLRECQGDPPNQGQYLYNYRVK